MLTPCCCISRNTVEIKSVPAPIFSLPLVHLPDYFRESPAASCTMWLGLSHNVVHNILTRNFSIIDHFSHTHRINHLPYNHIFPAQLPSFDDKKYTQFYSRHVACIPGALTGQVSQCKCLSGESESIKRRLSNIEVAKIRCMQFVSQDVRR